MAQSTKVLELRDRLTLSLAGARLVVVRGVDKGRAVDVTADEIVVGSGPNAHLQLKDAWVSRAHAAVRGTSQGWLLRDLDSTNGTRLEGRRIVASYLAPGDRFEIGRTEIKLEGSRRRLTIPLSDEERFGPLIGKSVAARRLFALLARIAPETVNVLLTGETGSGKDLAAQAIHEASPRRSGPFVVIDCGSIVGSLVESELFGHEKGAFTGATSKRRGAFQEAHGGTLFLDEIGELPLALQPKLLRAVERREVKPVGSERAVQVDVRIISATNRDLQAEVGRGLFREDLFHRLGGVHVRVPPLRERTDDIPLLTQSFLRELSGHPDTEVPEQLLASFLAHSWPGNVRELRNRVERMLVDTPEPAPASIASSSRFRDAKATAIAAFERTFVQELIGRAQGNIAQAAREAQMDRVYLTKLIRKHRIPVD